MRNLLLFLIVIFSASAFAKTQSNVQTKPNHQKSYFYVGLDLGYADNHYDGWWQEYIDKYYIPKTVDSSGFAGRIKFGAVLNQYIGMEFGALFSPKIAFNDISGKYSLVKEDESFNQTIFDLLLRGTYPIKDFEFIVKTGIATSYQYNFKASSGGYDYVSDDISAQTTWALGGGFGYHLSQHVLAELTYMHYFAMSDYPGTDFVAAGISFKF